MVGWLGWQQNLCASTFIAALRHSEVKFGLTLCVWRSVSAQILIIIQLFIIAPLAGERNILTQGAHSFTLVHRSLSLSAWSSAFYIAFILVLCVWLMPRQLSVSQDEHAPLSFPDPIQRQAMLSPHLYIRMRAAAGAHVYMWKTYSIDCAIFRVCT